MSGEFIEHLREHMDKIENAAIAEDFEEYLGEMADLSQCLDKAGPVLLDIKMGTPVEEAFRKALTREAAQGMMEMMGLDPERIAAMVEATEKESDGPSKN